MIGLLKRTILFPLLCCLSVSALPFLPSQDNWAAAANTYSYDVVVVGGSEAGIAAAVTAARHGSRVAILEETDWIGGMTTAAGVSGMDGNYGWMESGFYKEFATRVRQHYRAMGKSVTTCGWGSNADAVCLEPSIGRQIFQMMIDDERADGRTIDIYYRTYVAGVTKAGNELTSVIAQDAKVFSAPVFIDASELGDLLAVSGAGYRAGNGTSGSANSGACVQDITYAAIMKRYTTVPPELVMQNPPPGYSSEVQALFARFVTADGGDNYRQPPVSWAYHNGYRGTPDSSNPQDYGGADYASITKTGINWANDYPFGELARDHGISYTRLNITAADLERANRKTVFCEAKLRTLQFMYYVQHDLGQTNWSVANDEGYDTPYNSSENRCDNIPEEFQAIERNMPQMPYIREGRRAVGIYTLTGKDIFRQGAPLLAAKMFSTSLATGDYPVDLHACKSGDVFEADINETANDMTTTPAAALGPFQIPFESFISADTDGLILAGKNLSMSRIANAGARHQPIGMLTGQAAGAIAALSVSKNVQPRALHAFDVQRILIVNGKSMLWPFNDVPQALFEPTQMVAVRGIMIGYGDLRFGANDVVNRETMAVFLARMSALPLVECRQGNTVFTDVAYDSIYCTFIEAVYRAGFTAGCSSSPTKFCPANSVTREELATFMTRAWQRNDPARTLIDRDTVSPSYASDMGDKTRWSFPFVETLTRGVPMTMACATGPTYFCPTSTITRADTTPFIVKTMGW